MAGFRELAVRTVEDLRHGRHREAYALFLIGVTLAVLGLVGVADDTVLLSTILLALSFLVFHGRCLFCPRRCPAAGHEVGDARAVSVR
jgi:hypothetical protein